MTTPQDDGQQPRPQPGDGPQVSTAPPRSRWWSGSVPSRLGRARTSTVVLAVLWAGIFVLWVYVRPAPVQTVDTGSGTAVVVPTTTAAPRTTSAPRTTTTPATTTPTTGPGTSTSAPGSTSGRTTAGTSTGPTTSVRAPAPTAPSPTTVATTPAAPASTAPGS